MISRRFFKRSLEQRGGLFQQLPHGQMLRADALALAAADAVARAAGALGETAVVVPALLALSIEATGLPRAALGTFISFYASCLLVTWWWYRRKTAEVAVA